MKRSISLVLVLCLCLSLGQGFLPKTRAAVAVGNISVPAYSGGTASGWMTYDGGAGATYADTGTQSKMRIITGTTASQYKAYRTKLEENGYTKLFTRTVEAQSGSNLYGKYLSKDGTHAIYTYFTAAYSQARIIVDTQEETFRKFGYSPTGNARTEVYMYGLSTAEDGWNTESEIEFNTQNRSNAGSMFIIKMSDNSLFVVDGGANSQMGDRSSEELYAFLRRITGVPEGQKITINTWHISHPHGDHDGGFPRFLQKYHEQFDVLNLLYNFDEVDSSSRYVQRVSRLFPNARYYKAHTGENFKISGVQFEVLYTAEDRYKPNSSNQLIMNSEECTDYNVNLNNTSMVLKVTFDGKKLLLLGDLKDADDILMKMYPASYLKCDMMQIPHHGFDNHATLAKTVAPSIGFLNQAESAAASRKNVYNNNMEHDSYIGTIYYGGTYTVGYAADTGVFMKEKVRDVDSLDWGTRSYDLEETNPYNGTDRVEAPEDYYRYTKVTSIPTTDKAYIIVDKKMNRVLSYNVANGSANSANTGLFDGEHWYFSSGNRHYVNWLIRSTDSGTNANSPISNAVTTYSGGVPVRKGSGDYWSSGTNNKGLALGDGVTFSATGMFDSFSNFSKQIGTSAKWTWIDALKDGSFLIYRHSGGTYYPLFRDGNVTTNGGWGTAKLTKSQISKNINYFKTELYAYEVTPSSMYLTWTGHKDYYCYTGISQANLLSLLSADLRVYWHLDGFNASGEAFHTARNEQNPGDYWLEFSPGYSSSTVGDYTATIRYKTAGSTIVDVGSFTVHVVDRDPQDSAPKMLYFDFDDGAEDRYKYRHEAQYNEINFDGTSRWNLTRLITDPKSTEKTPGFVDTEAGTLTITKNVNYDKPNAMYAETFAGGNTPLGFVPKYAEVIKIRFKMDNLKAISDADPFFRLYYFKEDGSRTYDNSYYLGKGFVSDGEYMTVTMDLLTQAEINAGADISGFPTQTMNSLSKITGIRLGFHEFNLTDPTKDGSVTVDYIYIGPKDGMPTEEPVLDESIAINHTLNLASDISVNFAVRTDLLTDYVNHYMVCEIPVYEGNEQTGTKAVTMEPVLNGNFYYYTLTGLTAVQMGDVVSAQLHMEKNSQPYLSKVDTYSVAQYAYSQMNKTTTADSLKALCADLLRYGKEAQIFKSYRTDALVDAAMTDVHRAYLSDAEAVTFGNNNQVLNDLDAPIITWAGKSLSLDSKVSLKYVFNPGTYAGKVEDLILKVHYVNHTGEAVEVILTDPILYNSAMNSYAFTFDGLLAAELRTVLNAAVYAGDTRLSQTLRYSPDTYGNNKSGQLLTLCKALFAYSDTAKAYFH